MNEVAVWMFFKVFISTALVVLINAVQGGKTFKWQSILLITLLFYIILI